MQDDIAALFAHDRWANRKVFEASRKLTAEQYVAEPVRGGRPEVLIRHWFWSFTTPPPRLSLGMRGTTWTAQVIWGLRASAPEFDPRAA
jgi:hypothetical protein